MKVLLVNGSPHKEGCTYRALNEIAKTLEKHGIDSEIFWIGNTPVGGCIACGSCRTKGVCVFNSLDKNEYPMPLIANGKDDVAVKRIINVPKRGIGDTAIKSLENISMLEGVSMFDALSTKKELEFKNFLFSLYYHSKGRCLYTSC